MNPETISCPMPMGARYRTVRSRNGEIRARLFGSANARVSHVLRVDGLGVDLIGALHDELLAGGDVGAHEQLEDPAGLVDVVDGQLAERAVARVHGRLGQLVGV